MAICAEGRATIYRLFIVEDDRGIAGAIREQAACWGFEVSCAENFRNVLGEVTAFSPHLVLMDISLLTAVLRWVLLVSGDTRFIECADDIHFLGLG